LMENGYPSVIQADNGKQFIEKLEGGDVPNIVLLDINMPVMDGYEMLEKLREYPQYKDLPVIMFSTSQSKIDKSYAEKFDAEFISKPTKYNELKLLVEQFVRKCRFEVKKTV